MQAEHVLGQLATQFRSASNADRAELAVKYKEVAVRLIESKEWDEMPPFEDQLPSTHMPPEFYAYWLD